MSSEGIEAGAETPKLFEQHLPEQMLRVLQAPSYERPLALKNRLERGNNSPGYSTNDMVKVKICGITNLDDALAAVKAGADALGFVFYEKSPRYITPVEARLIIRRLPKRVLSVGVFVNAREATIRRIARECGLDMLQFHGSESPEFCARFTGARVIKAFRIKDRAAAARATRYATFARLFDSCAGTAFGGTGKQFDWSLAAPGRAAGVFFLSGGLDAGTVRRAVASVRPQWVDVSSGVEAAPGKKDHARMRDFVRSAKG